MPTIRVPKQSDRDIVAAFGRVAKAVEPREYFLRIHIKEYGGTLDIAATPEPEKNGQLDFVLREEGRIVDDIEVVDRSGTYEAAKFNRRFGELFDVIDVFPNNYLERIRSKPPPPSAAAPPKQFSEISYGSELGVSDSTINSWFISSLSASRRMKHGVSSTRSRRTCQST